MPSSILLQQLDRNDLQQIVREAVAEAVAPLVASTSTAPNDDDLYLTRSELASMLRISMPTLQRRIADGTLQPVTLGGRILFRKEDVLRDIQQSKKHLRRLP